MSTTNKNEDFQDTFNFFLSLLKLSGKVDEVSSNFGPDKTLDSMLKYLWKMKGFHKCFPNKKHLNLKDDSKASEFRKSGNDFYKKKDFEKALNFYNQSIIYSVPVADPPESATSEEPNNLALAFANRSAVLFVLASYDKCLLDISRAVECNYPKRLMHKLIERKVKCYLALKRNEEAKKIIQESLENLEDKKVKENIKTLSSDFEELKIELNEESKNKKLNFVKYRHIIPPPPKEIPSLGDSNPRIPSLSSSGDLAYSADKGRHLVATRDIFPGEIVVKEKALTTIPLPSYLHTHCSFCLLATATPISCTSCTTVVFCKEECRKNAMEQFHSFECLTLPSLLKLDMGISSMLSARILFQRPISALRIFVDTYNMECESKPPQELGFDESGKYISSDYRTIYHLVTNKENRTVSDLFKRSAIALLILKVIDYNTQYFSHESKFSSTEELTGDYLFVANIIFTHLMGLPCNAHSIMELCVHPFAERSVLYERAAGAFGVLSLANHSCNPSISRYCYGQTLIARATCFIPMGGELTDCYGEHFGLNPYDTRQTALKKQYYFTCSCEACTGKWLSFGEIPLRDPLLRCTVCGKTLDLTKKSCPNCDNGAISYLVERNSKEELLSFKVVYEKVTKSYKEFKKVYEKLVKDHSEPFDFDCFTKVVAIWSRYTVSPNMQLMETQETLKHCYDMCANVTYLPSLP